MARQVATTLGLILGIMPATTRSEGSTPVFSLSLQAGSRVFDRLAEGDPRPARRGELTAGLELGYFMTPRIRASVLGRLGENFLDFDGAFGSGAAPEQSWSVWAGVDWVANSDGAFAPYAGLGYEYGEARSWVRTPLQDDEGPRNFFSGASARAGLGVGISRSVQFRWELLSTAYYAHTFDDRLQTKYRWLGQALGTSVGMSYLFRREQ